MNEVEKMYRNADVENQFTRCELDHCAIDKLYSCGNCKHFCKKNYPPFTAEKQIEIVKKILFSTWWLNLKRLQFSGQFDEALAQMINELWQDLTAEERKQIKNILE